MDDKAETEVKVECLPDGSFETGLAFPECVDQVRCPTEPDLGDPLKKSTWDPDHDTALLYFDDDTVQ